MKIYVAQFLNAYGGEARNVYVGRNEKEACSYLPNGEFDESYVCIETWEKGELIHSKHRSFDDSKWIEDELEEEEV